MTLNNKIVYKYEDGVEEGTFPLDLNIFEYFSEDTIRSIVVEYFNSQYDVEVKLNPFYVSGKEIKKVVSVMDAETKQLFIENNVWILFLRYDN